MKKSFELLLFDADGTLFNYDLSEQKALSDTYHRFNIEESLEEFLNLYKNENSMIWKEFENSLISADDLKAERFRRLFKKINVDINPIEFSNCYLDNLSQKHYLIDGTEELLNTLFGKFILVLITNGLTEVQKRRLKLSKLEEYFQSIIISEEVGFAKPDKQIFDIALKSVGHSNKKTTLIVGDNINSDIFGGIKFGISTCWFNPKRNSAQQNIRPEFTISKLSELENIIF